MKGKTTLPILILILLFAFPRLKCFAIYDPLRVPNNKYGIHVADTNDIQDTAPLVNSSNGDWGYVTIVMEENDRNQGKWQQIFNVMRRLHLIPIVRLATHVEGDSWIKPQDVDAEKWADFLDSLNWPIENRYIVLFNEPNHKKEWEGDIDPERYAKTAYAYAKKLKETSEDFFILPAGLDTAASSDGEALEAGEYLKRMYDGEPKLFEILDGWTSHSYPNPGFSGSPNATGKGTIRSFLWELNMLSSLGVGETLPVFITETGWVHSHGKSIYTRNLSPEEVGENLLAASQLVWNNPRIAAVTPFVFSYLDVPFDHFSWKKIDANEFYDQYTSYQKIPKVKGQPNQHESYETIPELLPSVLVINSTYTLSAGVKNNGQAIIHPDDGYELVIEGQTDGFSFIPEPLPVIEPGEEDTVVLHVKTPDTEGTYDLNVFIAHQGKKTLVEKKTVSVIPPPNMRIETVFGWTRKEKAKNVKVLVYDLTDKLLHKFSNLTIEQHSVTITGLYNMVPGRMYRVVVIVPYYLPRQTLVTLKTTTTRVPMKRLLPFDINNDGAFTINDVGHLLFTKPRDVLGRFF